jgi:hypothetical protein
LKSSFFPDDSKPPPPLTFELIVKRLQEAGFPGKIEIDELFHTYLLVEPDGSWLRFVVEDGIAQSAVLDDQGDINIKKLEKTFKKIGWIFDEEFF